MQDIIRKIISIDQNARDIVRQSETEIKQKEEQSRLRLEQIRMDIMEHARSESQACYDDVISAAQAEADYILNKSNEKIQRMEQYFASIQDKLDEYLFERIFLSEEGNFNQ